MTDIIDFVDDKKLTIPAFLPQDIKDAIKMFDEKIGAVWVRPNDVNSNIYEVELNYHCMQTLTVKVYSNAQESFYQETNQCSYAILRSFLTECIRIDKVTTINYVQESI